MIPSGTLIEDEWSVIRRLFPADLDQSAREHGAMQRRRGQKARHKTLEYTNYVVLLSTLNAQEMKLAVVLEFYRARWQVELAVPLSG